MSQQEFEPRGRHSDDEIYHPHYPYNWSGQGEAGGPRDESPGAYDAPAGQFGQAAYQDYRADQAPAPDWARPQPRQNGPVIFVLIIAIAVLLGVLGVLGAVLGSLAHLLGILLGAILALFIFVALLVLLVVALIGRSLGRAVGYDRRSAHDLHRARRHAAHDLHRAQRHAAHDARRMARRAARRYWRGPGY